MSLGPLPLGALRAFEASARHLNFTRAADELCVTQGAVSHQVRGLELRLGVRLFHRLPRGLALTDEALVLAPALTQAFERMAVLLDQVRSGVARQPLTIGVVASFAAGWLLPRLATFEGEHPRIDLRIRTHNNKVDLAAEGLDGAIQYGDGGWPSLEAHELLRAGLSPLCAPRLARQLERPADLARVPLLRSYRADEWPAWFAAAGEPAIPARGPQFDSSVAMAAVAERGLGVALAPPAMLAWEIEAGRLVQPFAVTVDAGAYYLTRLRSRAASEGWDALLEWLRAEAGDRAG